MPAWLTTPRFPSWSGMSSASGPPPACRPAPSQGDLTFSYFMGMAILRNVILLPGSVNECFEFGWKAFDIAERLQTPVIVLSDLDFGMNQWMTKPFEYPEADGPWQGLLGR